MTAQMPASAQEHYENLLADHYEWMFGLPFEAKVAEQKTILDEFLGKDLAGGLAVDLGCGSGFQSVALSDRGYKVLAIDTSEKLLRHLSARVGSRNIVTKHADLRELDSLVSPASVEIAVCMGDTLTHLSSRSEVSNFWLLVGRLPCRQLFEPASLFCIAIEECMMKAISYNLSFAALVAALMLSLTGQSALAQAPTAPQGGAPPPQQQQRNPAPQKAPGAVQQPPQAGVTIAVDVPIVTLDVVATTQHGDILTGLKKENFRVLDDGVAQTITNFGATEAPITIVMLMEFSSRGYYEWFAY